MNSQQFDDAVAATARRQAERLRTLGFARAAAEVDALLLAPGVASVATVPNELFDEAC